MDSFLDKIIKINEVEVSGRNLTKYDLEDLLFDKTGEGFELEIQRKNIDTLIPFSLNALSIEIIS